MYLFFILYSLFSIPSCNADPHPEQIFKQKNSTCVLKNKAGEYSNFHILKSDKEIFEVESDSVIATFSPDGKYIAFTGSDMDHLKHNNDDFKLLIFNCETEIMKGFVRLDFKKAQKKNVEGESFLTDLKWAKNNSKVEFKDCWYDNKNNRHCKAYPLIFDKRNSLP